MWTEEQVNKVKKYLRSKKGKEDIKKISERVSETDKLIDGMQMTWEEWNNIKDIPYNI